jgi:hypothetical protein
MRHLNHHGCHQDIRAVSQKQGIDTYILLSMDINTVNKQTIEKSCYKTKTTTTMISLEE